MNLGVETRLRPGRFCPLHLFQHSLMNLGVETPGVYDGEESSSIVSAFSDESWGGDPAHN